MNRIKWLFLFFIFLLEGFSQEEYDGCASFDFFYGTNIYTSNFYNQLNTVQQFGVSQPLQFVGVGISGHFGVTASYGYSGHILFSQVLPARIKIQDTIECSIIGNSFSFLLQG
jgi:hypothetical protein